MKYQILIFAVFILFFTSCNQGIKKNESKEKLKLAESANVQQKDIEIIIGSFLGDEKRCYYGENPPDSLNLIWKCWLGGAYSNMPYHSGSSNMHYGAGWTGQPLLFREKNRLFLLQGSYDYNLRKIDAETGEVIWKYPFDDAIKGTGTLWLNNHTEQDDNKLIVLQGSRQSNKSPYNFRAISALNGEELFRIKVNKTPSLSRDVDGSALVYNDTAYIGFENGLFEIFNPDDNYSTKSEMFYEPEMINEVNLYSNKDLSRIGGNIITESSPALLGRKVYIAAGSGYVYGYNIDKSEIDWQFFIGSDLNGSCVVTGDSCLLVPVEKQFISGNGGLLKLNPNIKDAIKWFFPVDNKHYFSWDGGIIGSASINEKYKGSNQKYLSSFIGVDGYLYVIDCKAIDGTTKSFDGKTIVNKPQLIFKYKVGTSISTPLIFKDKIIAASYSGIYVFKYNSEYEFELIDKKSGVFEATPIVYNEKIFIGSKDGWLYCFGDK